MNYDARSATYRRKLLCVQRLVMYHIDSKYGNAIQPPTTYSIFVRINSRSADSNICDHEGRTVIPPGGRIILVQFNIDPIHEKCVKEYHFKAWSVLLLHLDIIPSPVDRTIITNLRGTCTPTVWDSFAYLTFCFSHATKTAVQHLWKASYRTQRLSTELLWLAEPFAGDFVNVVHMSRGLNHSLVSGCCFPRSAICDSTQSSSWC